MKASLPISVRIGAILLFTGLPVLEGCAWLPTMSPLLTNRKILAKTGLDSSGVIAFAYESNAGVIIHTDVRNLETGKYTRIQMNPPLILRSVFAIFGKEVQADTAKGAMISDKVAFYPLSPGRYQPCFNYATETSGGKPVQNGFAVIGDTFTVAKASVTSFGVVRINYINEFFRPTVIQINSTKASIDSLIQKADDFRLARWPIVHQRFVSNKNEY